MDVARLKELDAAIREQSIQLKLLQQAALEQEQRLAQLRAELEALRKLLADETEAAQCRQGELFP